MKQVVVKANRTDLMHAKMHHPDRVLFSPSRVQTAFLSSTARECLVGGAVGGGKTAALLVAPLRWAWHPLHSGILLRREQDDLREVIDRGREMYPLVFPGTRWIESRKRFEFPTGASLLMGSAQHAPDIEQYKTFEFNWIGFDELTTFERYQYIYMLSRNRSKDSVLPLHVRGGTNPDGVGHAWVFKRFIENKDPYKVYRYQTSIMDPEKGQRLISTTRQFIPATVFDNPHLTNLDEYVAGLQAMGKDLADALLYGKWDYFRGQMFPYGPHGGLIEVDVGLKASNHYVVRALDYGWSDPTVVQWLVVYPDMEDRPIIEVAYELVCTQTNVRDIAYLMKRVEERLEQYGLNINPPRHSVADPSIKQSSGTSQGKSIYDLFQQNSVWFDNATNDRISGWANLRMLLESGQLRVWRGQAPKLMETLPKLVRDAKKVEDVADGQDDHSADTLRYGALAVVESGVMPSMGPKVHKVKQDTKNMDTVYEEVKKAAMAERRETDDDFMMGW